MTPAGKLAAKEARLRFAAIVKQPDAAIDLARAALLIAEEEEPRGQIEHNLALLDQLGAKARTCIARQKDSPVEAFNQFMFEDLGFTGNENSYYDPRNSLLPRVLERRTGIPITLSVVYMEVGRRAGLRVEGIGLPGHFVVRASDRDGDTESSLVDPFYGKTISIDDCQERLDAAYGGQITLSEEHLRGMKTREILVRMLRNLQSIYAQGNLHQQALAVVERVLLLVPASISDRRERGLLLAQLKRFSEAMTELKTYLQLVRNPPDADRIREHLKSLQTQLAMLN